MVNIPIIHPAILKVGNSFIANRVKAFINRGKLQYVRLTKDQPVENFVRVRRGFEKAVRVYNRPEPGFTCLPIDIQGTKCEWVVPKDSDPSKVLLYFHGGGYHFGSIETTRSIVSQLTKQSKIRGLMVEYRKAPEDRYPAPIHDAAKIYNFLLKHEQIKPHSIAFGGDSAGGGITMGTLLYLKDNNAPMPGCAVLLSPWVDHTGTSPTLKSKEHLDPLLPSVKMAIYSASYMGSEPLDSKYASPIFHDLSGLPPLCIHVGEDEILLNDSTALAAKAQKDGVEGVELEIFPNMFHVFHMFHRLIHTA
jgi:monoterpene epsilon-lactone hydrolase